MRWYMILDTHTGTSTAHIEAKTSEGCVLGEHRSGMELKKVTGERGLV